MTMPDFSTLTPEALKQADRATLERLLLLAVKGLTTSLQNTQQLTTLLKQAEARIRALDDQNKSMEAELIVLRNQP